MVARRHQQTLPNGQPPVTIQPPQPQTTSAVPAGGQPTSTASSPGAASSTTPQGTASANAIPGKENPNPARSPAANTAATTGSTGNSTTLAATQTAVTPPTPEPNRYVGAGRDYPFTGTSTTYYSQSTAIDLAQTNLRNQAAAFCESSYKAEIRWGDPSCEASSSSVNQYLCTVDAMVNCYVNRCDQAFCGTRN